MNRLKTSLLPAFLLWTAIAGTDIHVLETLTEEIGDIQHQVTVLCVDGLKFLYFLADGSGTAVSLTQVYEERDGRAVPARCQMPHTVIRVPPEPSGR